MVSSYRRLAVAVLVLALAGGLATAPPPASAAGSQARWHHDRQDRLERRGEQPQPAPGELLVRFAAGTTSDERQRVLDEVGAASVDRVGGVDLVEVRPGAEVAVVRHLHDVAVVEYAELNNRRVAFSDVEVGWGTRALRAPEVWAGAVGGKGFTGAGVRIAVLDSGVTDQGQHRRVERGPNFVSKDPRDICGHGSAVASVAAASANGRHVAGVAPDATIIGVKVMEYDASYDACYGTDSSIAEGIRWAADPMQGRAHIINLSLGGPLFSRTIADAVQYATANGVLIVAAAGNAGDMVPNYPAALPEVISVGGLTRGARDSGWSEFSSFGLIDIGAPGEAVPVFAASGVPPNRIGNPCPTDAARLCGDGTSFAAPHVAGLAALLHEQHWSSLRRRAASTRPAALRQWILGTARDVGVAGVDLKTGHGLPDAVEAGNAAGRDELVLVTIDSKRRIISPTSNIIATPDRANIATVITSGAAVPIAGRRVSFRAAKLGTVSANSVTTDARGRATTVFRSRAYGRHTALTTSLGRRSIDLQLFVRSPDDNIRGVRPPTSPHADELDLVFDADDVFRFRLRKGETLSARLRGVDLQREYVDMLLHPPRSTDVTDIRQMPLREDTDALEGDPVRFRRKIPANGTYYLDVFGVGTYRLTWSITSPLKIRAAAADPASFSPDGDGTRDRTRLSWRVGSEGFVVLRIRNSDGKVVRTVRFGREAAGERSWAWNGRADGGRLQPDGRYRVTVSWRDGRGRVSQTSTRVTLRR